MRQSQPTTKSNSMIEVPERELLDLAAEGISLPTDSSPAEMKRLAEGLRQRKVDLYFPFFWTHNDVFSLHKKYLKNVSLDDVLWYFNELFRIVGDRYPDKLHWMERSNIYHTFGLIRLLGKADRKTAIRTVQKAIDHQNRDKVKSIIEISAHSTLAVLQERDAEGMKSFLEELISVPNILRFYGSYQIYYYGGFENCVTRLEKYTQTSNEIFIPQSMLSLLSIRSHINWRAKSNTESIVRERLFDALGPNAKKLIERYYKYVIEEL